MKHNFFYGVVIFLTIAIPQRTKAYDFSSVAPSGQTLYYNIINGEAQVTFQGSHYPRYTSLSGALVIPSSVTYQGTTYTVTSISGDAFAHCDELSSVTISNSVTSIGNMAFYACTGLTSVAIGNSVTSIGDYAFYGCHELSSMSIPNSVTSIGDYTFEYCYGLTSVTIGNSVTSIGNYAFRGCSGLTEITSLAIVAPTLGTDAFNGVPSTISIHIPCGSQMSYYSRWSYFSNFVEEASFTFDAESSDNSMGQVQILTMPTCTNPNAVLYATANSGYRFDHWSTGSTSNPYTLTVTSDTVIIAYFVTEWGSEGIGDVDERSINIYTEGGNIVLNGIENEKVHVFDMVGRPVNTRSLPSGVYLVKIGNHPTRKVVVIR